MNDSAMERDCRQVGQTPTHMDPTLMIKFKSWSRRQNSYLTAKGQIALNAGCMFDESVMGQVINHSQTGY